MPSPIPGGAPKITGPITAVEVLNAMKRFGGSFVKCLGEAGLRADKENLLKIENTWPEYWSDYTNKAQWLRDRG